MFPTSKRSAILICYIEWILLLGRLLPIAAVFLFGIFLPDFLVDIYRGSTEVDALPQTKEAIIKMILINAGIFAAALLLFNGGLAYLITTGVRNESLMRCRVWRVVQLVIFTLGILWLIVFAAFTAVYFNYECLVAVGIILIDLIYRWIALKIIKGYVQDLKQKIITDSGLPGPSRYRSYPGYY